MSTDPINAARLAKKIRTAAKRGVASLSSARMIALSNSNPRIDRKINKIGDKIGEHHRDGDDDEEPSDNRIIACIDRRCGQRSKTGPAEDGFNDDKARYEPAELQS